MECRDRGQWDAGQSGDVKDFDGIVAAVLVLLALPFPAITMAGSIGMDMLTGYSRKERDNESALSLRTAMDVEPEDAHQVKEGDNGCKYPDNKRRITHIRNKFTEICRKMYTFV